MGVLGALLLSGVRGSLIPMEWTRWELEMAGAMMPVLEVMMVAAVLFLLVSTLVRVVVRLVVGGALLPTRLATRSRTSLGEFGWLGGSRKPPQGCLSCV